MNNKDSQNAWPSRFPNTMSKAVFTWITSSFEHNNIYPRQKSGFCKIFKTHAGSLTLLLFMIARWKQRFTMFTVPPKPSTAPLPRDCKKVSVDMYGEESGSSHTKSRLEMLAGVVAGKFSFASDASVSRCFNMLLLNTAVAYLSCCK